MSIFLIAFPAFEGKAISWASGTA